MESRKKVIWDPPVHWSEGKEEQLHSHNETKHSDHDTTSTVHVEKKVEWIELLFDLVFVVVVAKISHLALNGIILTLSHKEQAEISCAVMGGGGHHRRLLRSLNHNEHNTTTNSPAPHHEENTIPFGLSPAVEKGVSSVIYFLLAMRIWTRQAKMVSSRKGGLDIIGRILFFLVIWSFGGMSTAMSEGFASTDHFDQVITGFTATRFFQLLDYLRLYRNSKTIQKMWGKYAYIPSLVELIGCVATLILWSLDVSRECGVIMIIASYFSGIPTKLCLAKFTATSSTNGNQVLSIVETGDTDQSRSSRVLTRDVVSGAMTSSLSSIHIHHYAERWGLALIVCQQQYLDLSEFLIVDLLYSSIVVDCS